ncbi:MAG TPA: hypothetical protein VLF67_03910 [Candidatus Saccharimonas sp.]|nr:hypothetical protein [Candidatus Saccharimonas sp.]
MRWLNHGYYVEHSNAPHHGRWGLVGVIALMLAVGLATGLFTFN